jgi:hypothetical protein
MVQELLCVIAVLFIGPCVHAEQMPWTVKSALYTLLKRLWLFAPFAVLHTARTEAGYIDMASETVWRLHRSSLMARRRAASHAPFTTAQS